jgi:hypothetical protein
MSNKIIVGPMMLIKESDEAVSIIFTDQNGQSSRATIGMNHALEMAKELLNWVCHSWLE